MAKVLVVGGAGYVGSTTAAWLVDTGHEVWVLDDLSTGHRELALGKGFSLGQAGDTALVSKLVLKEKFDCVMHFAARSLVAESTKKPKEYFENNVQQTEKLLDVLLDLGVRNFIFSSTCAIFGDPGEAAIHENLPKKPLNPYGETKLEVEKMLENLSQKRGLRAISLRYFNAAGAEPQFRVGEWHEPETHLIPLVLKAAAQDEAVKVYGTDYNTPDGTCIRDYIHVWDLAAAHAASMERLLTYNKNEGGVFEAYNLGSENGFSVREVIRACEEVTGKKIKVIEESRRPGDPPKLVADSTAARKVLGFGARPTQVKNILSSAWEWEKKRSKILRRAVFLDRDGTLNEDPGYLSDPAQLRLLPQVGEALSMLKKAGYLLVVISNQSGVGRGLIDQAVLAEIHKKLDTLLSEWSVRIDHYELCFHVPQDHCECRKPKPKLLLDAALKLQVDISQSYMIGDKGSDLGAGNAAACKGSILVRTGEGSVTVNQLELGEAAFIGESLMQAVHWILSQENGVF